VFKYAIPAIRNSDFLTGNHTCILHMHIKVSLLSEFKSHINLSPNDNFSKLYKYNTNMSYYNLCGIGSQHSNISRGKGGTYKNHWYARLQSR
jgi:hypothetical protein